MKRMLPAALVVFATACASTGGMPPEAAPPATASASASATVSTSATAGAVNPLGVFNFTADFGGTTITGSVEVTGQPGAYGGNIRTNMTEGAAIRTVVVQGQEIVVTAASESGPIELRMRMNGPAFTGTWSWGMRSGTLTGTRAQ